MKTELDSMITLGRSYAQSALSSQAARISAQTSIVGAALAAAGDMTKQLPSGKTERQSGVYIYADKRGGILDYTPPAECDRRYRMRHIEKFGGDGYVRKTPVQQIKVSSDYYMKLAWKFIFAGILILLCIAAFKAWELFGTY